MLTKSDLNSIGNLIDEKLETKLEEKLESKLEEKLESKLNSKLKPIKRDVREIKKDVKDLINLYDYDNESHHVNKRLDRLEDHLELPPLPKPYAGSSATS